MSPFFGPKIGEDQKKYKKGLRRKISGFLVHIGQDTKQNEKARSSPQISGVMVSHHNMVSPGAGRPPIATPLPLLPLKMRMALAKIVEICLLYRYDTVL